MKFTIYINIDPRKVCLRVVAQLDRLEPIHIHEVPERRRIKGEVKILNSPKSKKTTLPRLKKPIYPFPL